MKLQSKIKLIIDLDDKEKANYGTYYTGEILISDIKKEQ